VFSSSSSLLSIKYYRVEEEQLTGTFIYKIKKKGVRKIRNYFIIIIG
jgi:hypothetical protein